MGEAWAFIKIFVVIPVGLAVLYHGCVWLETGRTPRIVDDPYAECGTGKVKHDC